MSPRSMVVCLAWIAAAVSPLPRSRAAEVDVDAGYAVKAEVAGSENDETPSYRAENLANGLELRFTAEGVVAFPRESEAGAWSLGLRLQSIAFRGETVPVAPTKLAASGREVTYDFGAASLRYVNEHGGLEQIVSIAAAHDGTTGPATLSFDLAIGETLKPRDAGYFVDLIAPDGKRALRYGALRATDANGTLLNATIVVLPGGEGTSAGVRIVVDVVDPASPVEVRAVVSLPPQLAVAQPNAGSAEIVGKPVTLGAGITERVAEIMERERNAPPLLVAAPLEKYHEFEDDDLELQEDPDAPLPTAQPIVPWTAENRAALLGPPSLPQTVGLSFQGIGITEAPFIPPDSMGAVGPTQVVVHSNGRVKTFTKAGVADGALNATDVNFWTSVAPGGISDPQVRYDRLSGRWFLLAITIAEATNNKIVLAVSSGPTISSQASFTFYSFAIGTAASADATSFCDYPGMGVDANAIYTGCNMFSSAGSFRWTSAFVIRKSSVLSGGPMVVTGFATIGTTSVAGPYAPRGVDNDDPTWAEGYIIGTDPSSLNSRLNIRRVSNPGGTPTLGANVQLTAGLITTTAMSPQRASGSTTQLDVTNARLFAAAIRKNKLTGVTSLWTAHSVEVTTTCAAATTGTTRRIGARWYEIGTLTTTPTITQQGTLCTTATGAATLNSERGFPFPTVTQTGQGHMALSSSYASSAEFAGVAAAGRLRTDTAGGTRAPETIVQAGLAAYTLNDQAGRNRWGDYSATYVDPNDDQTVWTFQEYADLTSACPFGSCWSLRAVQLKAPPPPALATATSVCAGLASTTTTVTGTESCAAPTCTNGLCTGGGTCPEFFDPGPDTGGPGYANHIAATVSGGVTVNPFPATNIVIPGSPSTSRVLQATLSLNTTSATPGTKTITITNPDGQSVASASAILTVNAAPSQPLAANDGPICAGATLSLGASTVAGATYSWTGPNGFSSGVQNPSIPNATTAATGTYTVTVTVSGCTSTGATTSATVTGTGGACGDQTSSTCDAPNTCGAGGVCQANNAANGTSCNDGNACTTGDACSAGVCVSGTPTTCTASDQCHVAGVCNPGTGVCSNPNAPNGNACSDSNACTQTDTCQSGSCTGSNPVVCTALDQCHEVGSCNTGTGVCSNPAKANGSACSDSNACTQTDTCQLGLCSGANPVVCTALDQCHDVGSCNTGTGVCSNPAKANGSACNDGNACTQTDTCQSGSCSGANPVICTASDQCHVAGVCNPGTGVCSNPNAPDGNACSDSNACTQTDTCQSGSCTGSNPVVCTALDQCHDVGSCNTGTGVCSNPAKANGSACNDGDACTQTDTCQAGLCSGANPVVCSASDQCHVAGVCNPGTGFCSNPNAPNGNACSDSNACTQTDTCQSGSCTGSNPVVCTALDQCHDVGSCNTGTGVCSNPAKANGSACNDGDACTQTDTCQSGLCGGANPVVCSASDQCHVAGVCNPGTGFCSNPSAPDGSDCSDGNQCTDNDACTAGVCGGSPVPLPDAVNDSVRAGKTPTDTTISWIDPPGSYNVYRGSMPGGAAWSYNQTCLSTSVTGNSTTDAGVPASDALFYYLVTRVDACGESSLGTDSAGTQRPNGSACP